MSGTSEIDNVLDTKISSLSSQMVDGIVNLSSSGFIREGIIKQAIMSIVWDIYHAMPDQRDALIEALDGWEHPIRDAIRSDNSAED